MPRWRATVPVWSPPSPSTPCPPTGPPRSTTPARTATAGGPPPTITVTATATSGPMPPARPSTRARAARSRSPSRPTRPIDRELAETALPPPDAEPDLSTLSDGSQFLDQVQQHLERMRRRHEPPAETEEGRAHE